VSEVSRGRYTKTYQGTEIHGQVQQDRRDDADNPQINPHSHNSPVGEGVQYMQEVQDMQKWKYLSALFNPSSMPEEESTLFNISAYNFHHLIHLIHLIYLIAHGTDQKADRRPRLVTGSYIRGIHVCCRLLVLLRLPYLAPAVFGLVFSSTLPYYGNLVVREYT
jgi:hypothetical protein